MRKETEKVMMDRAAEELRRAHTVARTLINEAQKSERPKLELSHTQAMSHPAYGSLVEAAAAILIANRTTRPGLF
ncbi:MAG: hypothetical protein ABJ263_17970 [Tateyamaria sp.]|uniref:hypothetical protein n=1 Tax=Alphaproteobacteria TaxID=28211 RepID=UPI003264359A